MPVANVDARVEPGHDRGRGDGTGASLVTAAATPVPGGQAGAVPDVVVSILPLHGLVAAVMAGVGTPHLLVRGGASPHDASLRPSDARALSAAKLVVWAGPGLEAFLVKPLGALAGGARVPTLTEAPGMVLLEQRAGGVFEAEAGAEAGDFDGVAGIEPEVRVDRFRVAVIRLAPLLDFKNTAGALFQQDHARRLGQGQHLRAAGQGA